MKENGLSILLNALLNKEASKMAVKEKIRIRLKSYDHQLIDQSAEKIVEAAKRTGAKVSGPIPLPTGRQGCRGHQAILPAQAVRSPGLRQRQRPTGRRRRRRPRKPGSVRTS